MAFREAQQAVAASHDGLTIPAIELGSGARIEALAIGDELLDGRVADTNTLRLAEALASVGHRISQRTTICDDIDAICREGRAIAARGTKLCVVSGGLGPTADDRTCEAFAQLAGTTRRRVEGQAERIRARLAARGYEATPNHLAQADIPATAHVIPNSVGQALGFALDIDGCWFVSAAGVPSEFDAMIHDGLMPSLRLGADTLEVRYVHCFGLMEADVDRRLSQFETLFPRLRLGFRVRFPFLELSVKGSGAQQADLTAAHSWVKEQLGAHAYGDDGRSLAEVTLGCLRDTDSNAGTLAVAESCTGGLVGDLITDVPGSSDVFKGGVVAYHNQVKAMDLDVPETLLESHGAVSGPVVAAMASGSQARFGTTHAVAISGIAGPDGGTDDKPVGTVWFAVVGPNMERPRTVKLLLPYSRRGNKQVSAYTALDLVRRLCAGLPLPEQAPEADAEPSMDGSKTVV